MTEDIRDITERTPSRDRDGRAAYRVRSTDWNVSTAVVAAVAEVADGDLLDDEVLYDVVDPDALDYLFDGRRGDGRVVFELRGCRVEIAASDDLFVYAPDESGGSGASTANA
jgi:hypothetical protein